MGSAQALCTRIAGLLQPHPAWNAAGGDPRRNDIRDPVRQMRQADVGGRLRHRPGQYSYVHTQRGQQMHRASLHRTIQPSPLSVSKRTRAHRRETYGGFRHRYEQNARYRCSMYILVRTAYRNSRVRFASAILHQRLLGRGRQIGRALRGRPSTHVSPSTPSAHYTNLAGQAKRAFREP